MCWAAVIASFFWSLTPEINQGHDQGHEKVTDRRDIAFLRLGVCSLLYIPPPSSKRGTEYCFGVEVVPCFPAFSGPEVLLTFGGLSLFEVRMMGD
jgi:hypothetical protein